MENLCYKIQKPLGYDINSWKVKNETTCLLIEVDYFDNDYIYFSTGVYCGDVIKIIGI